ncbi:MAG: hypothetical protein OEY28_11050, partial [Nitrospira sp.]|nr:hypothetical protein [Nitrospira sp.]
AMLVFPALSATSIAGEHESKSFDLLLLTPMKAWEIALGKYTAAAIRASTFLIVTLPLFAMAALFGGIEIELFGTWLWTLVLLSILLSSVGIYSSSLVKTSVPAVLVTYLFSILLGLVLLMLISIVRFSPALLAVVGLFTDPTFGEAAYLLISLTVTCLLYCSILFIYTTNRLKPTSHNKSTGPRIFWLVAMIVVPAQLAGYVLIVRITNPVITTNTMLVSLFYVCVLLLISGLTFPAEPPLPSRRVKREMDRMPRVFRWIGGRLLYPGSARGVAYFSLITVVGFGLTLLAIWAGYGRLWSIAEDPTRLLSLSAGARMPAFGASGPSVTPGGAALSGLFSAQFASQARIALTLALSMLVLGQIVWTLSLTGLTRKVVGVLGFLALIAWLIVPVMTESMSSARYDSSTAMIGQFSPAQAVVNCLELAEFKVDENRYSQEKATNPNHASALDSRAKAARQGAQKLERRWNTFLGSALAALIGLLAVNLRRYRDILKAAQSLGGGLPPLAGTSGPNGGVPQQGAPAPG